MPIHGKNSVQEGVQAMCGIAGFVNLRGAYGADPGMWEKVLKEMNRVQKHRGPDEDGILLGPYCGFAQVRLSILDPECGHQPMMRREGGRRCCIVYNGEIYNMKKLRTQLKGEGVFFETESDTEVILMGYMHHGTRFFEKMNGIFAFAIWDELDRKLILVRDRAGVKPLFYTVQGEHLVFASEIKGLFAFPGVTPRLDRESLCEVFGLGPAKTSGKGVFADISEVLPGYYYEYGRQDTTLKRHAYWQLVSHPHQESFEETVEHTRWLVTDAVKLQLLSDVPVGTFLSGGVDSSLVTAIAANELQRQGLELNTFSFDFKDNDVNFRSNAFQPSQDRPWVEKMTAYCKTRHHYLECRNQELYEYLFYAVDARDLPGMADVESSMLYFCGEVAPYNKVVLTGECADEIFGGYPWFHKKECLEADGFPWSMDFGARTMLLKEEVLRELPLEAYAKEACRRTKAETPVLEGEDAKERRRREISYLNLKWFMATLLDRMDRTAMYAGLEARVPFADHRIMEYLWNVPWEMKCRDGVTKGLLRAAGEGLLPREILWRPKSPYPKTYDPEYEFLVRFGVQRVLEKEEEPLNRLVDKEKVTRYLSTPKDYGRPFYGQLMAGPQLLAWLLQVNYWLKKYHLM